MKPELTASYTARTIAARQHLGAMPYWALISQAERDKAAKSGAAMPDGSYPITTCDGENSVTTAVHAVGRGGADHDAIRVHIMKRAKSLGCPADSIPDNWNADGSLQDGGSNAAPTNALTISKEVFRRAGSVSRALSAARPRTEIISTWPFAVPPPPPPDTEAKPEPVKTLVPSNAEADDAVSSDVADIRTALEKAIADQSKDPDTKDPKDAKVAADLSSMMDLLKALETDQQADSDENKPPVPPKPAVADGPPSTDTPPPPDASSAKVRALATAPPSTVPPTPGLPASPAETEPSGMPQTNPVDEDGNIDNNTVCTNPDCGHFASAHGDLPDGDNTGACGMANCMCPEMQIEAFGNTEDGGGPNNDAGTGNDDASGPAAPGNQINDQTAHAGTVALADVIIPPMPSTPPAPTEGPLNQPPPVAGGESMGPAFTIPVAIIEGQPTGDGREIMPQALDWRIPPVPLMGLATATHDPSGMDMNSPAVICGRIDSFERTAGEGGTQIISAKGFYLPNDDGMYFAEMNEAMGRLGVSADVAAEASEVSVEDIDEMGFPTEMSEMLTKGTIMGLTVCPYPAFEGAYIVLGDGTDGGPAAIPQAAEPAMTAAGVHWMTYEECEPCQSGIDILVAAGGPLHPPRTWFENPNFTEDDGRLVEILEKRGTRALGGKYICLNTAEESGRVYGHIAPWGVCHSGVSGQCILAPHSKVDYAHFKQGYVVTAEGDRILTGVLTADIGHASQSPSMTAKAAMAHYDDTRLAIADVNVGEDEYGIWFAGALRPGVTDEQIRKFMGHQPSGDWRNMGGNLELVAALMVNKPGFEKAVVAGGQILSLVAAGSSVMYKLAHPTPPVIDEGDAVLRRALRPLLTEAKSKARERIAALSS